MENEIFLIKKDEVIDFLNSLSYGSVLVNYADKEARDYMSKAITVFNEINGNYVEERPLLLTQIVNEIDEYATEEDLGKWFRILFKTQVRIGISPINEADVEIFDKAIKAMDEKAKIIVKMNPKLKKYCEKLARNNGIKFFPESNYWIFSGEKKKESPFKLMQRANLEGQDKIEFELKDFSSQTIRCYASNLGAEIGRKLSVNISEGKIIVRFKEQQPEEIIYNEVASLYRLACIKTGHDKAREIFESVIFDAEFDNMPETFQQATTQTTTFNPTSDNTDDVQAVSESGQIYIKDPNVDIDKQDDDDF